MRNRISDEQGFTLIELLVVILIIGILAAIALPNFLGQRTKGQDASAKSNARNAVSMVESCYTDTQDYNGCTTTAAGSLGANTGLTFVSGTPAAGQVQVQTTAGTTDAYTINAKSVSGNVFTIAKTSGTGAITRSCTPSTACPAAGW